MIKNNRYPQRPFPVTAGRRAVVFPLSAHHRGGNPAFLLFCQSYQRYSLGKRIFPPKRKAPRERRLSTFPLTAAAAPACRMSPLRPSPAVSPPSSEKSRLRFGAGLSLTAFCPHRFLISRPVPCAVSPPAPRRGDRSSPLFRAYARAFPKTSAARPCPPQCMPNRQTPLSPRAARGKLPENDCIRRLPDVSWQTRYKEKPLPGRAAALHPPPASLRSDPSGNHSGRA